MSIKSTKSSESSTLSTLLGERFGERIRENCSLSEYVQTASGGVAEYLLVAESAEDITDALTIAQKAGRPCSILGAGTGALASHIGALGLVVINRADQVHFSESTSVVIAESGATNARIISEAASRGLGGLEFLIGIPGTIGGAISTRAMYQAKGLGSFIRSVVCWVPDGTSSQVITVNYDTACNLIEEKRRSSPDVQLVILAVHLQFSRLYPEEIIRRLRSYRQRTADIALPSSIIGRPFTESLGEYPLLRKDIERIRQSGLRFDVPNDIIRSKRIPAQPSEVRDFLETIKELARSQGLTLAERVTYLGYWPDEGANEPN